MSAKDLAKELGLSESAVRNQENGTNGMKVEAAGRYAAVLGVTPDWLLFGSTGDGHTRTVGERPALGGLAILPDPRAPVKMTSLGNGKARLEMNMVVPMSVALKVLALVHEETLTERVAREMGLTESEVANVLEPSGDG